MQTSLNMTNSMISSMNNTKNTVIIVSINKKKEKMSKLFKFQTTFFFI